MNYGELLITRPDVEHARAADLSITHTMTCVCVPVQFEGQLEQRNVRVVGYYFRHRSGRWSLSIGHATELDDKYLVIASGLAGEPLDGGLDHELAIRLIDAVLVAWHSEDAAPMPEVTR